MKLSPSERRRSEDLMDFIARCKSSFHAAEEIAQELCRAGFLELEERQLCDASLAGEARAFLRWNDAAVFAFRRGKEGIRAGLRIFVAHNDSPSLQIKPCPMTVRDGYYLAETLIYGGPVLNTHFDRPLGAAGRALVETGDGSLQSRLVDLSEEPFYLPNVAIHFNREVNNGHKIDPPSELRLIFAQKEEGDPDELPFERLIADQLDLREEQILDYDLFTYNPAPGSFFGKDDAFFSVSRIDDLGMVHAGLRAFLEKEESDVFEGLSLLLIFSNEEIGSLTRQGARSGLLGQFLSALFAAEKVGESEKLAVYKKSVALSADQAHGLHPNFAAYAASGTQPRLNGGPVLKYALSSYGTDAEGAAFFKQLCRKAGVPCQCFTNRSDLRGGSAIGPLLFPQLPVSVADIGNPQWAMHSMTESAGSRDQDMMIRALKEFF